MIADLRGTGAGDDYRIEGFGRYFCRTCRQELGSGDFSATIRANIDIEADRFPDVLGPPLGATEDVLNTLGVGLKASELV